MKSKSSKSTTTVSNDIIGMSSDVDDDQVLPDSLRKLEIVSVYSHSLAACKTNNERNQNPFLTELSTANSVDDRITKDLFGPSCSNCKSTDKPCIENSMSSIENDMENQNWRCRGSNSCIGSSSSNGNANSSNSSSNHSSGTGQDIVHSINKTIHFKHRDREKASAQLLSERKLAILREPILKSIGRSVYHNGNQNKRCCEPKSCVKTSKNERINVVNSAASVAGTQADVLTHTSTTATATEHHQQHHHLQKLCHHCANELGSETSGGSVPEYQINDSSASNKTNVNCQRVSAQTSVVTDPNTLMIHRIQNWRLADDANVIDFKSLVNECNHLTLRTTELHKTRNFQILQANQIDDTTATSSGYTNDTHLLLLSSSNDGLNHSNMLATTGTNAMQCSLSSSSSTSSNNSSSCSQQARMNSSNCDVTIDELASYIEFQLHLPKPMSSNVYEAMFS